MVTMATGRSEASRMPCPAWMEVAAALRPLTSAAATSSPAARLRPVCAVTTGASPPRPPRSQRVHSSVLIPGHHRRRTPPSPRTLRARKPAIPDPAEDPMSTSTTGSSAAPADGATAHAEATTAPAGSPSAHAASPAAHDQRGALLPPGPPLPRSLQGLAFWAARRPAMQQLRRRYGTAYTLHLPIYGRAVMISDPALAKELFTAPQDAQTNLNPNLGRVLCRQSMFALEGTEHRRRRKLLTPPLHGKRIAGYEAVVEDRKSTRLNSSHVAISYAVFC